MLPVLEEEELLSVSVDEFPELFELPVFVLFEVVSPFREGGCTSGIRGDSPLSPPESLNLPISGLFSLVGRVTVGAGAKSYHHGIS